jgi:dTDP-4-dehydrorhamnose reductase
LKVLVTGASGMVGRAVCDVCRSSGDLVLPYDHQKLDIGDLDRVMQLLRSAHPEVVINCAAWTDVDGCEFNEKRAFDVHARGSENLARASRDIDATFLTISTDYVFDGKKNGFYTQRDQPNPESVYAKSKLEGERRAQLEHARTIVVRTGFIFGSGGNNFLSTVVERARKGEKLKAISDAYGTPTYAMDLSRRLRELCERDLPGTYHVVNSGGGASFEEFTREAIRIVGSEDVDLEVVSMDSLKRAAPRPRNCRLRCLLSEAIGLEELPDWRSSLYDFVKQTDQSNTTEEAMR